MELYQLETFAKVAEDGNFTRAGEALGLTQPAVTRQIAALERALGTRLIERGGRSFRLTAAGQAVFADSGQVFAALERLKSHVRDLMHPDRGDVAVACVTTVGLYTLPSLIADYSEEFPDVHFRLWSGRMDGVIDRVLGGSADLGLVSAPIVDPRLTVVPLFDDPVIAVAAPSLAEKLPSPLPIEQFAEKELILFESPSRFRTIVDAALLQAGIIPNVAMEFDSHEAVRSATYLGRGIALVPEQAVPNDLATGSLVRLLIEGLPPISRTTALIVRKKPATKLPSVENFISLVVARYSAGETTVRS